LLSRNLSSMLSHEMNMMKNLMRLPQEFLDLNFRPSSISEYDTLTSPITVNPDGSRALRLCYDVRGFKPKEVKVNVLSKDNLIVVEGKHELKEKGHHIMRQFARSFALPENLKVDLSKTKMKSCMTPGGELVIEADLPRLSDEELKALGDKLSTAALANPEKEVTIPINVK